MIMTLHWRHNKCDVVSNQQRLDCLFKRLFRRRSKRTSRLCVTGLCECNSPVTCGFPSQRASNAEIVSVRWRHHAIDFTLFLTMKILSECRSEIIALSVRKLGQVYVGQSHVIPSQFIIRLIVCFGSGLYGNLWCSKLLVLCGRRKSSRDVKTD